ncbi:MAG TPA: GNAT family N-acetyltransferase [Ramlibacter sp.]|nr:GNAT family N-acetyltransferase [Ramlibacter sp.]
MLSVAPVTFRPIGAGDLQLLRQFVRGLSRETAYKRLLSGRTPTEEELGRWTAIDPSREAAVVATIEADGEECLIGVARYVMQSRDDTDFAIVVADAWQRRGVGRALMARLIDQAREHGIRRLAGITLASNGAMLSLAREFGFRLERQSMATTLTLDL